MPTRPSRPRIAALKEQGCDRILLVPLYPQYAGRHHRDSLRPGLPRPDGTALAARVRVVPPYFEDPAYIDALAASIRDHLAGIDFEPEALIASFHGMPQKYLEAGDPYHCQCQKTSRLMREKLGWPAERWHTTFQSQFGSDPWLQPYTIDTVERLAKVRHQAPRHSLPGFLRRLPGNAGRARYGEPRQVSSSSGGEKFTYIPCLNDSAVGHARHRADRAARIGGLALMPGMPVAIVLLQIFVIVLLASITKFIF